MGFFDFFRSRKNKFDIDEDEHGPSETWAMRMSEYGSLEASQKITLARDLLTDLGKGLTNPQVRNKGQDEVVLRAHCRGIPVQVTLDHDMGWISLAAKCQNTTGLFDLEWHPGKGPIPLDDDEDWLDPDGGVRIFVAKGVFLEDAWPRVEEALGVLSSLDEEDQETLYNQIQRHQLSRFNVTASRIEVSSARDFTDLADPVGEISAMVEVLVDTATFLTKGQRDLSDPDSIFDSKRLALSRPNRVKCDYCQTQFPLTDGAKCPNCGAPYTGG